MKVLSLFICWLSVIAFTIVPASSDITYDIDKNRIQVSGFPEESPATLDDVLKAHNENGWNVVNYDKTSDTYHINTSLWIGCNQDFGTFFQLGDNQHPKIKLVLKGNLWISSPLKSNRRRTDKKLMIVNRLTAGNPKVPSIQPAIYFNCSRQGEFGITVNSMADFYCYNTTITAQTPDSKHTCYAKIKANEAYLTNSTFSWMQNIAIFASAPPYAKFAETPLILDGVNFNHVGSILIYPPVIWETAFLKKTGVSPFVVRNCHFNHLTDGVMVPMWITFMDCVFENNRQNLNFASCASHRGVVLIDCNMEKPQKPLTLQKTKVKPAVFRKTSPYVPPTSNPGIQELTVLRVKVVNPDDKPLANCLVEVKSSHDDQLTPLDLPAVRGSLAVTDKNGTTPGNIFGNTLLLETRQLIPTDTPAIPIEKKNIPYRINVSAVGYQDKNVDITSEDLRKSKGVFIIKLKPGEPK